MKIRIYDAMFETANGSTHQHLKKFWWVNETNADSSTWTKGTWDTREQAYQAVNSYALGSVYVRENYHQVTVRAHSYNGVQWIQTLPDGLLPDNLVVLAKRHAMNQPNV